MRNRLISMFLTLLAVILFATACSSGASSPTPAPTSNLDGATLIQQRCSVCHPLSRVEKTKYPSTEWKTIVDLMISRGAQLTPEEEPVVVSYLAAHYGK